MKKIIVTSCLLLSASAYALDWTQNDSREVYDIMYLPDAGTFFGTSTLSTVSTHSKLKGIGMDLGDIKVTSTSFYQAAGYSITERISVLADVSYSLGTKTKYEASNTASMSGATSSESKSKGLGDPSLGAKFRLLDQRQNTVNLDFIPTYTFNSGESKGATSTNDGNNKNGGNEMSVELQLGRKFTDAQWMVGISATRSGEARSIDATDKAKTKTDANTSYNISADYLQRMNEFFFFQIGVNYGLQSEQNSKDLSANEKSKRTSYDTIAATGSIIYVPVPNLAVNATLGIAALNDYTVKTEGSSDLMYEDTSVVVGSLSARYQF